MSNTNRDLLVLLNQELMTPQAIEHEIELLHELLYQVENINNLVIAHEAIDLNKYKIIKKPHRLKSIFKQPVLQPFVFLNCNN